MVPFSLYLILLLHLTFKPLRLSIRLVVRLSSLLSFSFLLPEKVKILEYGRAKINGRGKALASKVSKVSKLSWVFQGKIG